MRRQAMIMGCMGVLFVAAALPAAVYAKGQSAVWPIRQYIAADSVLATYYSEFIAQYGHRYTTASAAFGGFCDRLRTSDLLTDRFNTVGLSPVLIHAALGELSRLRFERGERTQIRAKMLTIDLALETIQGSITQNHRAEFRREVIAEIPPIVYSG